MGASGLEERSRERLEEIPRERCLRLLGTMALGRAAVVRAGRPAVFLVSYFLDGESVVFGASGERAFDDVELGWVALEVDHFDRHERNGWTVTVQGRSHDVTDAVQAAHEAQRSVALRMWLPDGISQWVAMPDPEVQGHRLRHSL